MNELKAASAAFLLVRNSISCRTPDHRSELMCAGKPPCSVSRKVVVIPLLTRVSLYHIQETNVSLPACQRVDACTAAQ